MLITAFYHFEQLDPERRSALEQRLYATARATGLRGLCLLGPEGLNMTCSGDQAATEALEALLADEFGAAASRAQRSESMRQPFRHFKVRRRKEIVTLGRPDLVPNGPRTKHLSPLEWDQAMADPDAIVLDTRNDYEIALGKFKGAVDLDTKEFRDFPDKVRAANLAKDKPVLMYCTGGIRCEKALLELEEQGFENVRQLEGGILNYLKEFPDRAFEGECFVFDYRVAVDQQLRPTTRYGPLSALWPTGVGEGVVRAVRKRRRDLSEMRAHVLEELRAPPCAWKYFLSTTFRRTAQTARA